MHCGDGRTDSQHHAVTRQPTRKRSALRSEPLPLTVVCPDSRPLTRAFTKGNLLKFEKKNMDVSRACSVFGCRRQDTCLCRALHRTCIHMTPHEDERTLGHHIICHIDSGQQCKQRVGERRARRGRIGRALGGGARRVSRVAWGVVGTRLALVVTTRRGRLRAPRFARA